MNQGNKSYIIRQLSDHDYGQISHLIETIWDTRKNVDFYKWKYGHKNNLHKGLVAESSEGIILCLAGYWGRKTIISGEESYTLNLLDVMSAPDVRGKIYLSLFSHIRRVPEEMILFGFSAGRAADFFRNAFKRTKTPINIDFDIPFRRSIVDITMLIPVTRPIRTLFSSFYLPVLKLWYRMKHTPTLTIKKINEFDSSFDTLWHNEKNTYQWIQCRDKNYLEWRYLHSPLFKYHIWKAENETGNKGFMIATIVNYKPRKKGYISDWFIAGKNPCIFESLLQTVMLWFATQQVWCVETWCMEYETAFYPVLKKYLFHKTNRCRKMLMVFHNTVVADNKLTAKDIYFTLGDCDFPEG